MPNTIIPATDGVSDGGTCCHIHKTGMGNDTHTQKVRSYNVIDFKHTSAQEEAMLSKRNSSCAHRSSVHKITYNTVHDTESMSDV